MGGGGLDAALHHLHHVLHDLHHQGGPAGKTQVIKKTQTSHNKVSELQLPTKLFPNLHSKLFHTPFLTQSRRLSPHNCCTFLPFSLFCKEGMILAWPLLEDLPVLEVIQHRDRLVMVTQGGLEVVHEVEWFYCLLCIHHLKHRFIWEFINDVSLLCSILHILFCTQIL